jgi:hypothetical protein
MTTQISNMFSSGDLLSKALHGLIQLGGHEKGQEAHAARAHRVSCGAAAAALIPGA